MSVNSTIKPTIIQLESTQYIVIFLIKVLIVIRIIIIFRDIIHFQMYISDLIIEYNFKCLWALDSNALVKNKIKRVHNLENENITFLVSHQLLFSKSDVWSGTLFSAITFYSLHYLQTDQMISMQIRN